MPCTSSTNRTQLGAVDCSCVAWVWLLTPCTGKQGAAHLCGMFTVSQTSSQQFLAGFFSLSLVPSSVLHLRLYFYSSLYAHTAFCLSMTDQCAICIAPTFRLLWRTLRWTFVWGSLCARMSSCLVSLVICEMVTHSTVYSQKVRIVYRVSQLIVIISVVISLTPVLTPQKKLHAP